MSRPYPYRNVNWRTNEPSWEWSEAYAGWLALAEIHRRENQCRITRPDSTRSAFLPK